MSGFRAAFALQWRALRRGGVLPLLALAAVGWAGLLPQCLTADGTEDGRFVLVVRYAFGGAAAIVMAATAAIAAGSLAEERASGRLALTLVRPAGRVAVFLGRFAALSLCGAIAIGLAAAATGAGLWRTAPCDRVLRPQLEDPDVLARRRLDKLLSEDQSGDFARKVDEAGRDTVLWYLAKYEADELAVLAPGVTNRWDFPSAARFEAPYAVRLRIADCFARLEDADCEFSFRGHSGRLGPMSAVAATVPLAAGGAAEPTDGRTLTAINRSRRSLAFSPRHDLQLRARADAFGWNLARAALALAAVNAAVAAVGLLLGAALGKSVAVFAMAAVLLVAALSPSAMEEVGDPTESTRIDRLGLRICAVSAAIVSPLVSFDAVEALCDDACIERGPLARRMAVSWLALPGICALLAAAIVRRKTGR